MRLNSLKKALVTLLLALGLPALAADIDLFLGASSGVVDPPNVMLVIDNAANFSANVATQYCRISPSGDVYTTAGADYQTGLYGKAGAVEQCALYSVIKDIDTSGVVAKVNIGVMLFNANNMKSFNPITNTFSASCVGSNGGCLAMPLVPINATTKPNILEWIRQWEVSTNNNYNIKGNNTASGAVMQETWAYFFGKTGLSGRAYTAPDLGCGSKNVIFIGNAYRNNSTPGDSTGAAGPKDALSGTNPVSGKNASPAATPAQINVASFADTITTSCGTNTLETIENKGVYAVNWANYMKSQGITTFSIGVLGPTCNGEYAAHLTKMGRTDVGGGRYFGTNSFEELTIALKTILGEIQSVNSVFAAVSLPVSVNTQGTYLNQVFVGMFRPDKLAMPRWDGNLKQYKLGYVGGTLRLQDADGSSAINSLTGFITECARSFWTPNATDAYWDLAPAGGCLAITGANSSNYPDGNIVEKGAQGYKARTLTPAARNVKTCSPVFSTCSTTTALTDFATGNAAITQALLNPAGSDRDTLINWARGQNVSNDLNKGTTVMRPSIHGDIVHSRPVPLNHGTDQAPSIVVYYGGNDGALRAVNGNRGSAADVNEGAITSGGNTYLAGAELWSFIAPEFYGKIKRLYDNTTTISFPTPTPLPGAQPKEYGFDGPITAFQGTIGGVTKSYVYATMRRGGRAVYAFDVTTAGSPALLWKKGCPNASDDADCTDTDFQDIGQSWSSLKAFYATGYGSGTSPLLIMGGGYDNCEDYDAGTAGGANHNCATTKGNRIFVLDAATGAVVKMFTTERAVVADSTLARDSGTGPLKFGYTADLGGNVYRLDFRGASSTDWSIKKIASLGCDSLTSCTAPRKFMFAPSVATLDNATYYVMLGSGDREKPVNEYVSAKSVTNHFFMIRDTPGNPDWTNDVPNCGSGATVLCRDSLLGIPTSATPTEADLDTKKGWYLGLTSTEQVVTAAVTVYGVVTFSTHQPAVYVENSCGANLGTTRVYNINYKNAAPTSQASSRYADVAGDGLPPSPVAGQVTLDDGTTVPFCIGCSSESPLEGSPPQGLSSVVQPKGRLYWYIKK